MRAQNESPETVVRLVRARSKASRRTSRRVARPTRRRGGARGGPCLAAEPRLPARRSRRRRRARGARSSTSARRPAEGDDARRRGGRGRGERRPRTRARGERQATGRRTSASSTPTGRALPADGRFAARSSTRRARPRRARGAAGLRWRARPLPDLQRELLQAAAERVRPGGTSLYSVCTIECDGAEAVVDASGHRKRADRRSGRSSSIRGGRFLQTLPHVHGTNGSSSRGCVSAPRVARWPGRNWVRGVEIEPSSTRRTRDLGARIRGSCSTRAPGLPLRRRDGTSSRGHDRPQSCSARSPARPRDAAAALDCRLMVDDPPGPLRGDRELGRRQRHVPRRGDAATSRRDRAGPGPRSAWASSSTRRPRRSRCRGGGSRRRPLPVHLDRARLLGAGVHAGRARAARAGCARSSTASAGRRRDHARERARATRQAPTCSSPAPRSRRRRPRPAYRRPGRRAT